MRNFVYDAEFRPLIQQTTAGTTAGTTGDYVVDLANFDGVCYVGMIRGISVAGGTIGLQHMHADTTGASFVSCTGAAYISQTTAGTTSMNNGCIVLDVANPVKRYACVKLVKADQASEGDVIAMPYRIKKGPSTTPGHTTAVSGIITEVLAVSPTS